MDDKVVARFWSKVDKNGPTVTHVEGLGPCWVWTGAPKGGGYGATRDGLGTKIYVHRLSWEIHHGGIPPGLYVLHKCDRRSCVRPSHLWLGTYLDNARDRDAKGRQCTLRGEQHGSAKLSIEDVLSMRAQYSEGRASQYALARSFGITQANVSMIVLRRTWAHV